MTVTDPRDRYDDLLETQTSETVPPAEFAEAAASEVATAGWVVLGFAFDEDGRVLLVDQPWADGWLAPGGSLKPGETLREAVTREVREETGIAITPVQPRAVDEYTVVNAETDETFGWTAVFFEARAETTEFASDLGVEGEEIEDATWFDGLPDDLYRPELIEAVYRRCTVDGTTR